MVKLYLIGALKDPRVPHLGNRIRSLGFDVVDTWWGAGPRADEHWQEYEKIRRRSYTEALYDHYAEHTFAYDKGHLDTCDIGVLTLPCGKSGHIELGYLVGKGKITYILTNGEPERFDLMYRLVTDVFLHEDQLLRTLKYRVS